jgi:pyridoxine 4-dehydrogenase
MADMSSVVAASGTIDLGGDLTVRRIGFGAMRLTGAGIWGEPPDRDEAKRVLRRAVELGVNFIDTADSYGPEVSETLIRDALAPYPDDLVIGTKGGLERPGPDHWTANGRPDHLVDACEGSLRRLGVDQIPVYQLHRPDPAVPLADSIGALVELKGQGKIRHIGVSNVDESQLREAQQLTAIVSVQNRYNVADRRSDPIVDLCEQESLAFLPWAPIASRRSRSSLGSTRSAHDRSRSSGSSPAHLRSWRSPAPVRLPTSRATWRQPGFASPLRRSPASVCDPNPRPLGSSPCASAPPRNRRVGRGRTLWP